MTSSLHNHRDVITVQPPHQHCVYFGVKFTRTNKKETTTSKLASQAINPTCNYSAIRTYFKRSQLKTLRHEGLMIVGKKYHPLYLQMPLL